RAGACGTLCRSREEGSRQRSGQTNRSGLPDCVDATADRDGARDCAGGDARRLAQRLHARVAERERVRVRQVGIAMHTCKTCWSRREFLFRSGGGVSGVALAYLLNQDQLLAGDVRSTACDAKATGFNPYAPKTPHFKPRATSVISLFMSGGVSHVDT